MEFGKLNQRIIILKKNGTTTNSMGEVVPAFRAYHPNLKPIILYKKNNTFVTEDGKNVDELYRSPYGYWCNVVNNKSNEYEVDDRNRYDVDYVINMRYVPDLAYDMLVLYRNKNLIITSIVDTDEFKRKVTLTCTEEFL